MMAAAPAKFTFDLDLGHVKERSQVLTEHALQEKLRAARQEGYDQGFAAGETGAVARSSAALAASAERLATQAAQLAGATDAQNRRTRIEAVRTGRNRRPQARPASARKDIRSPNSRS